MNGTDEFMEIGTNVVSASWLVLTLFYFMHAVNATKMMITRQNIGDIFAIHADDNAGADKCLDDFCSDVSNGTAIPKATPCTCQCPSQLSTYREDLQLCVNELQECTTAIDSASVISTIFLSDNSSKKAQSEISFTGMSICHISGLKVVTENGWVDLQSSINDIFQIYREDGKTFLLWTGPPELLHKFFGRVIILYLTCNEENNKNGSSTSCSTFKIANTPKEYVQYINEVTFVPDANVTAQSVNGNHIGPTEYIAITICSMLIGLIYVASVFLYLHLKKKRQNEKEKSNHVDQESLRAVEEGAVKNNPLLSLPSNYFSSDLLQSDSQSSDNETMPKIVRPDEDKSKQFTSAMVHYQQQKCGMFSFTQPSFGESGQDSATNERLPEQNVSIVETLEGKEDNMEVGSLPGITRKKLYFNPAYLEPQLLLAPPPAAIEFLTKIREVITAAKLKLSVKRFTPSLMYIPEEEYCSPEKKMKGSRTVSREGSVISLKRENSRKRTCTGCPGCETNNIPILNPQLSNIPELFKCYSCTSSVTENKQRSIRQWLENVPVIKNDSNHVRNTFDKSNASPKRVRSPSALSLDKIVPLGNRCSSHSPHSEIHPELKSYLPQIFKDENVRTFSKPTTEENIYETVATEKEECVGTHSVADKLGTFTKKHMNEVIKELKQASAVISHKEGNSPAEYETDSLERKKCEGYSTPTKYAEIISSVPSPCLSTVLPNIEEITMKNAILSKETGLLTNRKITTNLPKEEEHEYELLILKKGSVNDLSQNLPQILQNSHSCSLVSEVYVNNGYNYGSTPSTPNSSAYSSLEKRPLKIRYQQDNDKPGKLLIEVDDCADHYIPVHESDSFEPDTLDRKSNSKKDDTNEKKNDTNDKKNDTNEKKDEINEKKEDISENPNQILLRTTGSFRNDQISVNNQKNIESSNFNRVYGSLREIYEAKTKRRHQECCLRSFRNCCEKDKHMPLNENYSKRQRSMDQLIPPDLIPPPNQNGTQFFRSSSERLNHGFNNKPPVPPKNGRRRDAHNNYSNILSKKPVFGIPAQALEDYEMCLVEKSKKNGNVRKLIPAESVFLEKSSNNQLILHPRIPSCQYPISSKNKNNQLCTLGITLKPEDSGYLSTDSNESRPLRTKFGISESNGGSETDESLDDPGSESGAESIETHSVFFNRFSRQPLCCHPKNDAMAGRDEGHSSSDSESVSFTTIIPVSNC